MTPGPGPPSKPPFGGLEQLETSERKPRRLLEPCPLRVKKYKSSLFEESGSTAAFPLQFWPNPHPRLLIRKWKSCEDLVLCRA